jgi:hypothetical protein
MIRRCLASCFWIILVTCLGSSQVRAQLDSGQSTSGLRQALTTGTTNAVNLVGRPGGYFSNPASRSVSRRTFAWLKPDCAAFAGSKAGDGQIFGDQAI